MPFGANFDTSLVSLKDVQLDVKKIAGVRVPVLLNIELETRKFGLFSAPKWYFDGIRLLQGLAKTAVEREFVLAKLSLLDHARKKTTQKVNLFEKVQIPGFQEAVRKIKRFMEDEENLSKSSQKILKSLQEARSAALIDNGQCTMDNENTAPVHSPLAKGAGKEESV